MTIDRIARFLFRHLETISLRVYKLAYWIIFLVFYILMLFFVWPTLEKSLTILALISCALLMFSPSDYRFAVLTFLAGSALGYLLEIWGTTRLCWTYYTQQTPPVFAVFAHGLASLAFWRVGSIIKQVRRNWIRWFERSNPDPIY